MEVFSWESQITSGFDKYERAGDGQVDCKTT